MSRKRWIWTGAGIAALAVIAFIGVKISDGLTYVNIAAGYTAQQTCSCLHVSGRTLDSCRADYPPMRCATSHSIPRVTACASRWRAAYRKLKRATIPSMAAAL